MIIRGGMVVTARGLSKADIRIAGEKITAVGPNLPDDGEEIDASGLHVFPGGIDSHVHFNEPGRTEWEDIAHGSAALAAGGYTTFVDMPLNSSPVTVDGPALDLKVAAARSSSLVDFGFWGGLVPGNVDKIEDLVDCGVMGFKAFMCGSGIDDFPAVDEDILREGMRRIANAGSILLVHAEDPGIVMRLAEQAASEGRTGPMDFVRSRPAEAELDAIAVAVAIARDTGCRLHIVHVSTEIGVNMVAEAQSDGIDVSCETCPHYLLYTEEDLASLGGIGKCAPPFRTPLDRDGLWRLLGEGILPMVVSDHSPSTIDLKAGSDFFRVWGGISGCQSTRQLLLAHATERSVDLPTLAAITATNPARRFGMASKGEIDVGFDADLWLVDLSYEDVLRKEDLLYRNRFSAHEGQRIRGRTMRTMVRGNTAFIEGRAASTNVGRLVKPSSAGDRLR